MTHDTPPPMTDAERRVLAATRQESARMLSQVRKEADVRRGLLFDMDAAGLLFITSTDAGEQVIRTPAGTRALGER